MLEPIQNVSRILFENCFLRIFKAALVIALQNRPHNLYRKIWVIGVFSFTVVRFPKE